MNDSQQHRPINDSLAKQQWLVKNLKRVQYLRVKFPFLKKKTRRLDTSSRRSHFKDDLGLGVGWVFIHGAGLLSKEETLMRPLANWSSSNPADHQLRCCYGRQLESCDADQQRRHRARTRKDQQGPARTTKDRKDPQGLRCVLERTSNSF